MFNVKKLLNEKFHSTEINVDDLKKLINDFVKEAYPGGEIESFDISESGMIDIKLVNGEQIEIEVDWNELILK